MDLSDLQIEIIRFIQGDLPLEKRPFAELSARLGVSEDRIVEEILAMKSSGVIRRFGMAVRHQNMGYTANGMSCWDVPDDRVKAAADALAGLDEVSHCYERPRFDGWPYNVYAMIHGKSRDRVLKVAGEIAGRNAPRSYDVLFSTKEYKRTSMSYFVEED